MSYQNTDNNYGNRNPADTFQSSTINSIDHDSGAGNYGNDNFASQRQNETIANTRLDNTASDYSNSVGNPQRTTGVNEYGNTGYNEASAGGPGFNDTAGSNANRQGNYDITDDTSTGNNYSKSTAVPGVDQDNYGTGNLDRFQGGRDAAGDDTGANTYGSKPGMGAKVVGKFEEKLGKVANSDRMYEKGINKQGGNSADGTYASSADTGSSGYGRDDGTRDDTVPNLNQTREFGNAEDDNTAVGNYSTTGTGDQQFQKVGHAGGTNDMQFGN